jgi:small subunit ribosomal protein S6
MATQQTAKVREYETVFLIRPELTDDGVDKLKDRVKGIITREGGKVLRFTVWGKKKTAYVIAKQPRAIYVHGHYLGGPALVAEIERNLRNIDEVTRYTSVKLADDVDPASKETLEDLKLAGDVDDRPGAPTEREPSVGFRESSEEPALADEETSEEA